MRRLLTALLPLVGCVWLALLVIQTARQVPAWASDETLWRQAALRSPRLMRPHANLGSQLMARGAWSEAWLEMTVAARLTDTDRPLPKGTRRTLAIDLLEIAPHVQMTQVTPDLLQWGGCRLEPHSSTRWTCSAD